MKALKAGTKITCPHCHKVMVRLKTELNEGDIIAAALFDPVGDQPIHKRLLICPFDGTSYGAKIHGENKLHTEEGWK